MTPTEKRLHQEQMLIRSFEGTIKHKESRKEDVQEFEKLLVKAKTDHAKLEKQVKAEKTARLKAKETTKDEPE